ncbi:MBL fold metallo-hydrolase [Cytobacillus sp. FJAT-54145]|uniref:beta-lactamase n=1 Tax=Cytobacillus spartinae TaxID=3299023 RepID=A0ABW6K8B7_9BACI
MKLLRIKGDCYYFQGAVNIGYILKDGQGLLIDTGLEASTTKKIVKQLKNENLPLNYLIITHGHADHYGGAAYLHKNEGIKIFAPKLEAAILENPILEPLYLFHGANPLPEFRNKFLEGEAVQIDHLLEEGHSEIGPFKLEAISLPGHSYNQMGVRIDDILYAADSYFGIDALKKHKIPYIVDCQETIQSLVKLQSLNISGAVPGHGHFEEDFKRTVAENLKVHEDVIVNIKKILKMSKDGISFEQLMKELCKIYEVSLPNVPSWMLYRTAVTAYVTKLVKAGEAQLSVKDYTLNIYMV